jgi:hypothetical protein
VLLLESKHVLGADDVGLPKILVVVFAVPPAVLSRKVKHKIEPLFPKNRVHLLKDTGICLGMHGIFTLQNVARPNLMAARPQFIR